LDVRVFSAVVTILKGVESAILSERRHFPFHHGRSLQDLRSLFGFVWVCLHAKTTEFTVQDIIRLQDVAPSGEEMVRIWSCLDELRKEMSFNTKRLYRNQQFFRELLKRLSAGLIDKI
jgi:hypothetical protein